MTKPYTYLFGPVPSRRLGVSLGVDLVPSKTCSLDCVYCESGATTRLTVTRKAWVPLEEVKTELDRYLSENDRPDAITFSGAGEPTLHSGIGELATYIKTIAPDVRLVLLTNSTLFHLEDVREDAARMDLVIASYDAWDGEVFNTINRPHPSLTTRAMAEGLELFRGVCSGELWLEFFVVQGVNDHEEEVARIAEVAGRIRPHRIQVNTLDRPGAEPWVTAADAETLKRVTDVLNAGEVISSYGNSTTNQACNDDVPGAILAMIGRRPGTRDDFLATLGVSPVAVDQAIATLLEEGTIVVDERPRGRFFKLSETLGK